MLLGLNIFSRIRKIVEHGLRQLCIISSSSNLFITTDPKQYLFTKKDAFTAFVNISSQQEYFLKIDNGVNIHHPKCMT